MKIEQKFPEGDIIIKDMPGEIHGTFLDVIEPLTEQEYNQMMQWRPKHAFFEEIGFKSKVEEMEIGNTGIVMLCRVTTRCRDSKPTGHDTWGNPEWRKETLAKRRRHRPQC
jgi:hypothetical protein